jgi:hypothetical protein
MLDGERLVRGYDKGGMQVFDLKSSGEEPVELAGSD